MHINICISACMRIQAHMLNSLIVTIQPAALAHYHITAEIQAYVPSPQRHAGCLCVCFHFIHVTVWLNHPLLYLFLAFLLQLQNEEELFISVENDLTKIAILQKVPKVNPSESTADAPLLAKTNYVIKATGAQLCVYSLFDNYSIIS